VTHAELSDIVDKGADEKITKEGQMQIKTFVMANEFGWCAMHRDLSGRRVLRERCHLVTFHIEGGWVYSDVT
jgi:hypothetical protein